MQGECEQASRALRFIVRSCVACLICALPHVAPAQSAPNATRAPAAEATQNAEVAVCEREQALTLVRAQASEARKIDDAMQRVGVLVRAADLLWRDDEAAARALFTEAYEVATTDSKKVREPPKPGMFDIIITRSDLRFEVLRRIAKHDGKWAQRLAETFSNEAEDRAKSGASSTAGMAGSNLDAGADLLAFALSLLETDESAAVRAARLGFRHRATMNLPRFLYELAKRNRQLADAFYEEAVGVYANGEPEDLVYLSPYAFGLYQLMSPARSFTSYAVPEGYAPNPRSRQLFVEAWLRLADRKLKSAPTEAAQATTNDQNRPLDQTEKLYAALTAIEALLSTTENAGNFRQLIAERRMLVGALLENDRRERALGALRQQQQSSSPADTPSPSLRERVERIEKETQPSRRDMLICNFVLNARDDETFAAAEKLFARTDDAELRKQLANWLYFRWAQETTRRGTASDLDDAAKRAARVEEVDFRALLALDIAAARIKLSNDRMRAAELLEEVRALAWKADPTSERTRALLGVAHAYAAVDRARMFEALGDAVKSINQTEKLDLTSNAVHRRIKGRDFAIFTSYSVPGFNIENVFRETAARDFNETNVQAQAIQDRYLRALAILATSAACLERRATAETVSVKPEQ